MPKKIPEIPLQPFNRDFRFDNRNLPITYLNNMTRAERYAHFLASVKALREQGRIGRWATRREWLEDGPCDCALGALDRCGIRFSLMNLISDIHDAVAHVKDHPHKQHEGMTDADWLNVYERYGKSVFKRKNLHPTRSGAIRCINNYLKEKNNGS